MSITNFREVNAFEYSTKDSSDGTYVLWIADNYKACKAYKVGKSITTSFEEAKKWLKEWNETYIERNYIEIVDIVVDTDYKG